MTQWWLSHLIMVYQFLIQPHKPPDHPACHRKYGLLCWIKITMISLLYDVLARGLMSFQLNIKRIFFIRPVALPSLVSKVYRLGCRTTAVTAVWRSRSSRIIVQGLSATIDLRTLSIATSYIISIRIIRKIQISDFEFQASKSVFQILKSEIWVFGYQNSNFNSRCGFQYCKWKELHFLYQKHDMNFSILNIRMILILTFL